MRAKEDANEGGAVINISNTHENEEECDEERHPALDVLAGDEEARPTDHHEERAGEVIRDHVVGHATRHRHLEAGHAVVA